MAIAAPANASGSQILNAGWLLEVGRNTILTSEPWQSAGVTVDIANTPTDITVYSSGRIDVQGKLERTPNGLRDIGAVTVEVYVDGQIYMRFDPCPFLMVSVSTFTTTRDIERGEILSEGDVATTQVDVRSLPSGDLLTNADAIVGKAAKINLQSGKILTAGMLEMPTLVHRGEAVVVYVAIGDAAVTLSGIALDDGVLGEEIRVRNPDSRVIITATVTGPSRAEIVLPE
jgi:flagella basal body P-ring formation protein FlgA